MNIIHNKNKNYLITILGILLINISISLLLSFFSFLICYINVCKKIFNNNIFGLLGYNISYYMIYNGFGIFMFILPIILFFLGSKIIFKYKINNIIYHIIFIFLNILLSISLFSSKRILLGKIGIIVHKLLIFFIGYFGLFMFICTNIIIYIIILFKINPQKIYLIFNFKNYIKKIFFYIKNNIFYVNIILNYIKQKNNFFVKKMSIEDKYFFKKKT